MKHLKWRLEVRMSSQRGSTENHMGFLFARLTMSLLIAVQSQASIDTLHFHKGTKFLSKGILMKTIPQIIMPLAMNSQSAQTNKHLTALINKAIRELKRTSVV